jgi:uncharacterized membrane protein
VKIALFVLIFLSLGLDATDEGPWNSPVAPLGGLLIHNLNKTIPVDVLSVRLSDVVIVLLLVVQAPRFLGSSPTDNRHHYAARPMLWAAGVSVLTVLLLGAIGIKRGGDGQMVKIQVQTFVMLLVMAILLAVSLRGDRDYRALGRVIVAAACVKALLVLWIDNVVVTDAASRPQGWFATAHGDSLLFVCAATILFVRFAEKPVRRHALMCILLLPLVLAAILANNRRLAWVELAAAILTYLIVARRNRFKLVLLRSMMLSVPVVVAYVAIGWNSESSAFAPVRTLRSVSDADVDSSTLFRDLENYNLLYTLRQNPFTGTGFGVPYNETVFLPDISFYKEYRFMPHNSVLGLWSSGGLFGFTGLSAALVVGSLFAACSYRRARSPDERVAAFTALATIMIFEIQCWGDIGFSEVRSIFLVGPALAVASQLAVRTGAWGPYRRASVVNGRM